MAVKQVLALSQLGQDVMANTSQMRILWTSTQTNDSHNLNKRTAKYWISINGAEETEHSVTYTLSKQTTDTILDTTIEVPHNDQGKAVVTVRTWMDTRISAGEIELEETLTLTDIPRAATISATDAFIGSRSTVVIGGWNIAYAYSVAYRFGELSGFLNANGDPVNYEIPLQASVINFVLPDSFYSQIPDDPSGVCTLTCRTYSAMTLLGQNECTFTVTADPAKSAPVIFATVVDCNPKTLALTGDENVLIRGKSTARCKVTVLPGIASSIQKITVCGEPVESSIAEIDIPNADIDIFEFTATDSRGYTSKAPVAPKNIIPYTDVLCYPSAGRSDPTSGDGWVVVEGIFYAGSFGTVDNSLSVICIVNGNTMTAKPITDGDRYIHQFRLTGLDYTKSYTADITVSDALSKVTKPIQIHPGIPVFDWGEGDFRFNVPVDLPKLTINGQTLEAYIRSIVQGG
jgi:hypothetical protein